MDSFSYYHAAPIILSDFPRASKGKKLSSSSKLNILSDVTNNYKKSSENTSKKQFTKPAIQLLKKQVLINPVSYDYSAILLLDLVKFPKPVTNNNQDILYYTNNNTFWRKNENGILTISIENLLKSLFKKQSNRTYQILDSINKDKLSIKISAPSLDEVLQLNSKIMSFGKGYGYKRLAISKDIYQEKIFDSNNLSKNFTNTIDAISKQFNTEIYLSETANLFGNFGPTNANDLYLFIIGKENDLSPAELRCKLLIDDLKELYISSLNIDLGLISLIGGSRLENFKSIIKQTGVFLYMPELLNGSLSDNQIFISGIENQVLSAKYMLKQLKEKVFNDLYFKDSRLNKIKLNFMSTHMNQLINKIMYKHGSFIQLPEIASRNDNVKVQGDSEFAVENTLKDLIDLQSSIYELEVNILGSKLTPKMLNNISNNKNTLILTNFKTQSIKIFGTNLEIKKTLNSLETLEDDLSIEMSSNDNNIVNSNEDEIDFNSNLLNLTNQVNNHKASISFEYRINIELPNTEKEFICGKKNGKLIKIMNQTSSKIEFSSINEYNFLVMVSSNNSKNLTKSITLLELEFPSELSFYIPEIYHRQIIGIGGNLIQTIMRKYNVFIKFSNTFELKQGLISFQRSGNVLIKCPKKNEANIPRVKQELENLVKNCQDLTFLNFKLSENQFKLFLNNFNSFTINEIEKKTNTFINFPMEFPIGSFYNLIELKGIDTKSSIEAFKKLSKFVPKEKKISIISSLSSNFQIKKIVSKTNDEFVSKISLPFKLFLNVHLHLLNDSEIVLTYYDDDYIEKAIKSLENFLKSFDFKINLKKDLDFTYTLVDSNKTFNNSIKKHGHSQSLSASQFNNGPVYKKNFFRSPPVYSSNNQPMNFSPVECNIPKFNNNNHNNNNNNNTTQFNSQYMTAPIEIQFPTYAISEVSTKNGLLPPCHVNK